MKSALANYKKSYQLNPENIETQRMIDRLEQQIEVRGDL